MSTIIVISSLLVLISIGVSYISLRNVESEEAKIINDIQIKYPNNARYFA